MQSPKDYFSLKGKKAETLVHELANKSFLTDWCYRNPMLPDNKELCDLLVVFDDTAIIWQIKNLKLNKKGYYKQSEAEKNLRQLSGAYRKLFDLDTEIELHNPRRGKEIFDPKTIKNIFLISAMLGKPEKQSLPMEEVKGHNVHVFSSNFTEIVLNELDTIVDFCSYLNEKELLLKSNLRLIVAGGEEHLLGYYILNGRSFSKFKEYNLVTLGDDYWEGLQKKPEYIAKKKEDKISYGWDQLINVAHTSGSPNYELMARELARPHRFLRRYLSKIFVDLRSKAHKTKDKDKDEPYSFRRIVFAPGTTYCFLCMDDPEPRAERKMLLEMMCFVARGVHTKNKKVLGIATERTLEPKCSYDFCFMDRPKWNEKDQEALKKIQTEVGLFLDPDIKSFYEEEFPNVANDEKR